MTIPANFPTVSAGGFSAYIDFLAYEPTDWGALIHALSFFGHKTAVETVRVRLRAGETATLATPEDLTAHLVLPETFVSRARRTGEVTHATLLREPRSLTAQSFLVLVRDDEDPTARFHRVCDGLITTPTRVCSDTANCSSTGNPRAHTNFPPLVNTGQPSRSRRLTRFLLNKRFSL